MRYALQTLPQPVWQIHESDQTRHALAVVQRTLKLHLRAEGQPVAFIPRGSEPVIEAFKVDPDIVIQTI